MREYGAAFADVYDRWYPPDGEVPAATALLRELAAGGAALELGVGTGRHAIALAAAGVEVWGLDNSPEMLAVLRSKEGGGRVHTILGDMAEIPLPPGAPPFALVFVPFNSFYLLTSEEAQERCLRRVVEVLGRGGRLLLEAYAPVPAPPEHESWVEEAPTAQGSVTHRYRRDTRDPRVLVGTTDGRPWALRPLRTDELDQLASEAGLELEARWQNWRRDQHFGRYPGHVSVWRVSR